MCVYLYVCVCALPAGLFNQSNSDLESLPEEYEQEDDDDLQYT